MEHDFDEEFRSDKRYYDIAHLRNLIFWHVPPGTEGDYLRRLPQDIQLAVLEMPEEEIKEAIEEAVQYAEAKDVHLNIESEPRLLVSTPQDVERLTTEIPSYALGINADIGHWYVCEEDVSAWIRKFGKRIRGADIEDIGLKDGKPHHHHLVPGKCVMPLADIFEAFRYIGFEDEHWYTIELYSQSDRPVEVAVETMTWLRNFEREMG